MASSVVNGERAEIRAASNCSSHVNRVLTTSLVVQLRVRVQRTVARETASDSRDLPVPRPLTLPRAKAWALRWGLQGTRTAPNGTSATH